MLLIHHGAFVSGGEMKVSLQGICSMLAEEAIVLSTYDDGTGTLTIGAGHTAVAGAPKPTPGLKISLTEAINIFRNDLDKYERGVASEVKVALSQHQFDALVSWHFNTGAIGHATLTQKLNAGDYEGAAAEFQRWNKSKGKVLDGLIARRERETAMFRRGEYGNPSVGVYDTKNGHEERFSVAQIEALFSIPANAPPEEEQTTDELLANPSSSLLPANRPAQKDAVTRAIYTRFSDLVPADRRKDAVAIVAIRGYYLKTMGSETTNDRGVYDDAIFVLEPNNVHNFNGNTDPGKFARGVARLKSHQAVRYRPGMHGFNRKGGPYPAFRQDSDCTVIRDEIGEDTDSANSRFWINLHRGGNTTTSSLGCQTIPPHQWNEFKTLVDGLLKRYGQDTFYYVLVDVSDIPKEVPMPAPNATDHGNTGSTVASGGEPQDLQQRLKILEDQRKALEEEIRQKAKDDPLSSARDPELTPINGMLGSTVGKALDGRKTLIGILGMLVTTVLPIFFPQLAPVAKVVSAVGTAGAQGQAGDPGMWQQVISAAFPASAAMTVWGFLGKGEKWVRAIRAALLGKMEG